MFMIQHDLVRVWPGDSIAPPNTGSCDQKPSLIFMKFEGLLGLIDVKLVLRIFFTPTGGSPSYMAGANFHLADTV